MKHSLVLRRRGAIAPLTALLLIPLLAMVAFAIDVGWITHTKNQLQAGADAAALAGPAQFSDGYVRSYLPGQANKTRTQLITDGNAAARAAAKKYAGYNQAG